MNTESLDELEKEILESYEQIAYELDRIETEAIIASSNAHFLRFK